MEPFEIPQNLNPMGNIIKVIGVGGGGSNAVKYLYHLNVKNVDFIVCNTDRQHLMSSPIPNKIQLGKNLTKGLGAGCIPEKGRDAAIESKEEIKHLLKDGTEMLFIAAGLGGGTGTGAAPVIAEVARSLNILTVAIVTLPFKFEGKKKMEYAEKGLEELRKQVDSIIVIPNEKLKEIYPGMKMSEAFAKADDVVSTAAKSIAEIITNNLHINVDFNDVRTVMQNSGTALMGTAIARGDNRALEALKNAINHPLLIHNNIKGAKHILLSITTGTDDISTEEFDAITEYIEEATDGSAEVIPGYGTDPSLGDAVCITIVATGIQSTMPSSITSTSTDNIFSAKLSTEEVNLFAAPTTNSLTNNTVPPNENPVVQSENASSDAPFKIEEEINPPENTSPAPTPQNQVSSIDTKEETPTTNEETTHTIQTNIPPLTIPNVSSNTPSVVKIIEREPLHKETEDNHTTSPLSTTIEIISKKTEEARQRAINLKNSLINSELDKIPAYIRAKEQGKTTSIFTSSKDHSNYTVDDKGNIKPGSPYLNDQVD